MKVRTKLFLITFIPGLLICLAALYLYQQIMVVKTNYLHIVQTNTPKNTYLTDLRYELSRVISFTNEYGFILSEIKQIEHSEHIHKKEASIEEDYESYLEE